MKKFEKLNTAKFQTLEPTRMDQAKGGMRLRFKADDCNKKSSDGLMDIDWDVA